jgi:sulfoacetaldehyde dehydrogenase
MRAGTMSTETMNISDEVRGLIRRARQAQEAIEAYSQQQVDELTTAVAWSVVRQDRAEALARLAVDEGGFGNYTDKVTKIRNRIMGTLADMANLSGTPAYGVGVGNSVHVVDETADLESAAREIAAAKTFDYATSCLADNAVIAVAEIYDDLTAVLVANGAYMCNSSEKASLQRIMWPDPASSIPSVAVIARSAAQIVSMAGITIPGDRDFLVVEENGVGLEYPFSGEKLSVVLALYRYEGGIENAVKLVNSITNYQGRGHTCGIHTRSDEHVMALAYGTKTGWVLINQNLNEGAGSPRNGLPYTLSLSCGTWGAISPPKT